MPASRLPRDPNRNNQLLINEAIRKAGNMDKLAAFIGYQKETLISVRANGMVSRRLEKVLKEYVGRKES